MPVIPFIDSDTAGSHKLASVTAKSHMLTSMPACNVEHCLERYQQSVHVNSSDQDRCKAIIHLYFCMSKAPRICALKSDRFKLINAKRHIAMSSFHCNNFTGASSSGSVMVAVMFFVFIWFQ